MPWGITGSFPPLSPALGHVVYALRTRPPVSIAEPLDLHVLGLPLAFILSQDQTLHRIVFRNITEIISHSFLRRTSMMLLTKLFILSSPLPEYYFTAISPKFTKPFASICQ